MKVRARHLFLSGDGRDRLAAIKQRIEKVVTAGLAKLPPGTGALDRERARVKLVEDAFSAAAREYSACPSKEQGGDLGWFGRSGTVVEEFAKAAFALKPLEVSNVVETSQGLHLILVLERKAGPFQSWQPWLAPPQRPTMP